MATFVTAIKLRFGDDHNEWFMMLRIPPQAVIDQLDEVFGGSGAREMYARLATNADLVAMLKSKGIGMADALEDPAIQQIVLTAMGPDAIAKMGDVPADKRDIAVKAIRPYCGDAIGLLADNGMPAVWEQVQAANEPYYNGIFLKAARAAYDHCRGPVACEVKKN